MSSLKNRQATETCKNIPHLVTMFFGPVYPYLEFPLRSLSTLWSSLVVIGSYINRYFLFLDMIRPVFVTFVINKYECICSQWYLAHRPIHDYTKTFQKGNKCSFYHLLEKDWYKL